jgi:hypothetical protein
VKAQVALVVVEPEYVNFPTGRSEARKSSKDAHVVVIRPAVPAETGPVVQLAVSVARSNVQVMSLLPLDESVLV